jgi:hypothetical protein
LVSFYYLFDRVTKYFKPIENIVCQVYTIYLQFHSNDTNQKKSH